MKIIPAIDLMDGKVVRLKRGDFKEVTSYSDDPADMARRWEAEGAELIHVVDLDGALHGTPKNIEAVKAITSAVHVRVELGGGIRTEADLKSAFDAGVSRVVIDTKLADDMAFIVEAIKRYGVRVIAGIDARDGFMATQGWTLQSRRTAIELAKEVQDFGVSEIIYTDISKDGMLSGPNIPQLIHFLTSLKVPVISSGGVTTLEDIKDLLSVDKKNLSGVIIGRALYEDKLSLSEAVKLCSQSA